MENLKDIEKIEVDELGIKLNFTNAPYIINWENLRTEKDLLFWVYDLLGKDWMNPLRLKMFLVEVAEATNIKLERELI
ncbi:MAG: hypothetical protein V3V16_14275 [Melioribacteraceae bacterium]